MNSPRNLAARAGRWSAQHRKTAIIGWILFIVVATFAGKSITQKELPKAEMGNGESKRSMQIMESADFPETVGEQVLIQGKGSIKSDDPEVTAAVKDTVQRLERIDGVTDIHSPLNKADRARHRLPGRPLRGRQLQPARRRRGRGEADRVGRGAARSGRRGPEGSSRGARRGVRRRLRAPCPLRHRGRRRGEVHAVLVRRHAAHPAARLRRHGRRRRPAVPRPDLGRSPPSACSGRSARSPAFIPRSPTS